jgi:hypothetical protein
MRGGQRSNPHLDVMLVAGWRLGHSVDNVISSDQNCAILDTTPAYKEHTRLAVANFGIGYVPLACVIK